MRRLIPLATALLLTVGPSCKDNPKRPADTTEADTTDASDADDTEDGSDGQAPRTLLDLGVAPGAVYLTRAGATQQLAVMGYYDDGLGDAVTGVTWASSDPGVASVDGDGLVTAHATGEATITASAGTLSRAVAATVALDTQAPGPPLIMSYLPVTDLTHQSWIGTAEPDAALVIAGAAAPLQLTVPASGRFAVDVPLTPGAAHAITVTLTDAAGNARAPYPFPIRHDPAFADAGAIHVSEGDHQRGVAGDVLAAPLRARVTDHDGRPLAGREVEFQVVLGTGTLGAAPDAMIDDGPPRLVASTDANGYARVWWRLSAGAAQPNRVCARLPGDSGLPAMFDAEALPASHGPTQVRGLVLDEHRRGVAGATVHIQGTVLSTQTDARGQFEIAYGGAAPAPTAPTVVSILVDGSSAPADGGRFATISFEATVLPGMLNRLTRPFYVPFIPTGAPLQLDAAGRVVTGVALRRSFAPGQPETVISIPAGTRVTWPAGLPEADRRVALVDIPIGQTPKPLPDGLDSRHVIAIQPHGTVFEPPLPVDMPNVDGIAPGTVVPLLSWNHEANRFLPVGTCTVTNDGLHVVSDPGSGIRVAAWHNPAAPVPPGTCQVTVTPDGERGTPCICSVGGVSVGCRAGESVDVTVPCDGTDRVATVECEEDVKGVKIVAPPREPDCDCVRVSDDKEPKLFTARVVPVDRCPQAVRWFVDGGEVSDEPVQTIDLQLYLTRAKQTVRATSDVEGCSGEDSVLVEAKDCCVAGSVRVCGDQMDCDDAGTCEVSGNVIMGRGRELFLRSSTEVTCVKAASGPPAVAPKASADNPFSTLRMTSRDIPFFGHLQDTRVFSGPWEIDGASGAMSLGTTEDPGHVRLEVLSLPLLLPEPNDVSAGGAKPTMEAAGLRFPVPELGWGLGAPDGDGKRPFNVAFTSLSVLRDGLFLDGKFVLEPDGGFKIPGLPITFTKFEFEAVTAQQLYQGKLGVLLGSKPRQVGVEAELVHQQGEVTKLGAELDFSSYHAHPITSGIPLFHPVLGPFLRKLSFAVTNPESLSKGPLGYLREDKLPSLSGGFELGLAPAFEGTLADACIQYSSSIVRMNGEIRPEPRYLKLGGGIDVLTVSQCGFGDPQQRKSLLSGSGSLEIFNDAATPNKLQLGVTTNEFKALIPPPLFPSSLRKLIADGKIDFTTEGIVAVSGSATYRSRPDSVLQLDASATFKTPAFRFFRVSVPSRTVANASASLVYRYEPRFVSLQAQYTGPVPGAGFAADIDTTLSYSNEAGFDFHACVDLPGFDPWCTGTTVLSSAPYGGAGQVVDVPAGLPAVEVALTFDGADIVGFGLRAPDGTLYAPDDPSAMQAAAPAFYVEDVPPGQSTWLIVGPPAGAWQLVGVTDPGGAREVVVGIPDGPPTFAFAEPFAADATGYVIAFTAADPDGDASIDLSYASTPDAADGRPIATLSVSDGLDSYAWDTSDVPAGSWFVCARVDDGASPVVKRCTVEPLLVAGADDPGAAPLLVRGTMVDGALEVTWLDPDDRAGYSVRLAAIDGRGTDATRDTFGARRRTRFAGVRPGDMYRVTVSALGDDGEMSASSAPARVAVPGSGGPAITSTPPPFAMVGTPWTYDVAATGAVVVTAGPGNVQVAGARLTWTPTATQLGRQAFALAVADPAGGAPAVQEFVVQALDADGVANPIFVSRPESLAEVGVAWSYTPVVATLDGAPATLTLVTGPAGMTLSGGVVAWTPSVAELTGRDTVAFTLRATGADLRASEQTGVVRFDDPDGDGLDTAWERAVGLDPYAADDASADPDQDGLTHAQEMELGTLGDVADSDHDGLSDGLEAAGDSDPRLDDTDLDGLVDADEATAGSDARLADSDGDGVPDGDEVAQASDPMGGVVDGDGDGLSDDLERLRGTDPANADPDQDGVNDADELALGSDPFTADTDGDGASDGEEVTAGTDPLTSGGDDDEDGVYRDLEIVRGLDPARIDTDGDGFEDGVELFGGSDATDPGSTPGDAAAFVSLNQPRALFGASAPTALPTFTAVDLGVIPLLRDDDRDGAPNDYELQWSYDPRSAADGASDDDRDGLPLWREAQLGTDPTAADTDGDGVSDGQEGVDGTDPNDPDSFNDGGPITSLSVYPPAALVTSNSYFGPAELQLWVVGRRADGTTADVTAGAVGTTYQLSDPGAGAVGADGHFVHNPASAAADVTITVGHAGLSVDVPVTLAVFTPTAIAAVELPDEPGAIAVVDGLGVIALDSGLQLVDLSDPEAPDLRGRVDLDGALGGVALRSTRAYAARSTGLVIVDVADPDAPTVMARVPLPASARDVILGGTQAYVATDQGLFLVRVEPPGPVSLLDANGDGADDRVLGQLNGGATLAAVDRTFGRVLAGAGGSALAFDENSDVLGNITLSQAGTVATPGPVLGVLSRGSQAFATADDRVHRVDLAATPPTLTGSSPSGLIASGPLAAYDTAVVATRDRSTALVMFFRPDPSGGLTLVGNLDFGGLVDITTSLGLAVEGEYHFVTGSSPARPHLLVGRHAKVVDLLGQPPIVELLAPAPGAEVVEGTPTRFRVRAVDDVAIAQVALRVDGAPLATLERPPYEADLALPNVQAPTPLALSATATDVGGNAAELGPISVTVIPVADAIPPEVAILDPAEGQRIGGGGTYPVTLNVYDDHAIDRVTLALDGVELVTLEAPPWQASIPIPLSVSTPDKSMTLTVRAYDYADNLVTRERTLYHAGVDLVGIGVTTLGPADASYDGADIAIQGGTVAIDGAHTFGDVAINTAGVLTHSPTLPGQAVAPLELTAASVTVAAGGAIDLSAKGYVGGCGGSGVSCPSGSVANGFTVGNTSTGGAAGYSGGSHGGKGGGPQPPATYGALGAPVELGSGGYRGGSGDRGGSGGGRLRLIADALTLDGVIRADGETPPRGLLTNAGSGGAGGSVWITVTTFSGDGAISADGGDGGGGVVSQNAASGGGGGRVAVDADDRTGFTGGATARGGSGLSVGADGAAGSVFFGEPAATSGTLVVDTGPNATGGATEVLGEATTGAPVAVGLDLVIRGHARLVVHDALHPASLTLEDHAVLSAFPTERATDVESRLIIETGALTIGPDATIDVTGLGYTYGRALANSTDGAAIARFAADDQASGASHGGVGAGQSPGGLYGDPLVPTELGAGGSAWSTSAFGAGGSGGGRVAITATSLDLDGAIRADGAVPPDDEGDQSGGGGAGGSVRIDVQTLSGAGVISAAGGASGFGQYGNGGGGGRVAVSAGDATNWTGRAEAPGGLGDHANGGPGTVATLRPGEPAVIRVDDAGVAGPVGAFYPEVGRRRVFSRTANTITGEGVDWAKDSLVGTVITTPDGAEAWTVVSNTENKLTLDTGGTDLNVLKPDAFLGRAAFDATLVLGPGTALRQNDELTVGALTIEDGALLSHDPMPANGLGPAQGLRVTVVGELVVASGGAIDVSGRGYVGPVGGRGRTLGGDVSQAAEVRSGGSHGGGGGEGRLDYCCVAGPLYGDLMAPDHLGSAGGSGGAGTQGGNGGGRVWITADALVLDGAILADGARPVPGDATGGGGGSGGAIRLELGSISGEGLLSADGGDSALQSETGGGGGGRIAIAANDLGDFDASSQATTFGGAGMPYNGGPGTVVVKVDGAQTIVRIDAGGVGYEGQQGFLPEVGGWYPINVLGALTADATTVNVLPPNPAPWLPDQLIGAEFLVPDPFQPLQQVAAITGNTTTKLTTVGLSLTNALGAYEYFHGRQTLPARVILTGGARPAIADRLVLEDLIVESGATLRLRKAVRRPTLTPGSPIHITASGTVQIDAGGAIDASASGFAGGDGSGGGGSVGYTIYNEQADDGVAGAGQGSGGSHFTLGGGDAPSVPFYDLQFNPMHAGSGGGGVLGSEGGQGGGAIWVFCESFVLAGALRSDGGDGEIGAGGGAGGGIWVHANFISGTNGDLSVRGGDGEGGGAGGLAYIGGHCLDQASCVPPIDASGFALGSIDSHGGSGLDATRDGDPGDANFP